VNPAPASVLVVDDDALNRKLLVRLLEQEGHRARTAEDGRQALGLLRAEHSDVVLLDIVMPELDGISVLEQLKSDPALHHLPVIMISAVDEFESVVRCIEIGAEDYLPKPFDAVLLRARINAGLTKKRLHELEREQVRGAFSRFVPEHVVQDVLARTDADLRLAGSRDVGTIMFTDIRGFTTFSETAPPELVLEILNDYFDEMIEAIFDHGGTLVGYRGDGLLVVFGAPLTFDDHADRALAAAGEMLDVRLPRFNARLVARGISAFRMGIGLNSGSFMSGNVGSRRRMEYTVHGDTVNTASRIEGMTKESQHPLLMAESTVEALTTPRRVDFVGEFAVRGRQSAIRLWTLGHEGATIAATAWAVGVEDELRARGSLDAERSE
jgi:class 3 adenylate cyclase